MTEHTNPAADDPAKLDQGGELVPFPAPAQPKDDDDRAAAEPDTAAPTEDDELVPVDPPELPASALGPVWERETSRRPVLPAWVTDDATRRARGPVGGSTAPCTSRRSTRSGSRCTAPGWPPALRVGSAGPSWPYRAGPSTPTRLACAVTPTGAVNRATTWR